MPELISIVPAQNFKNDINGDLGMVFLEFEEQAIFLIDERGIIQNWNKGAESIFQYKYGEVTGNNIDVLFVSDEVEIYSFKTSLDRAIKQGRYKFEKHLQRKSGKFFFAQIILTPLFNDDGSVKGFALVIQDITEQKNLQEENRLLHEKLEEKVEQRTKELAIVNKELEAFSYSVSHDLRIPLRAINGYSEILKEDYEHLLDTEGIRILNNIMNSSKLMGKLIDDLLSFSRMSRLEVLYDAVNMNILVQDSLRYIMYGKNANQYSIDIKELPPCKGDPDMLKQVWTNLIDNAVKYSYKKTTPKIEIGALDEKGDYVYYVKDNGTGFDMKYSEKLFGVFQRLHRQDEFEGTGLGLALSKRIVSKHGGEIWAKASLDEGATFFFSLPKSDK